MKEIKLHNGCGFALVDDEDYEWIIEMGNWYTTHRPESRIDFYVCTHFQGKRVLLHRVIFEKHYGEIKGFIDHKDCNTKNNQKINLRIATQSQNMQNRSKMKNTSSIYKGVSFVDKYRINKWQSSIRIGGKLYYLGLFPTEKEAGIAYNIMAKENFKDFAKLNDIQCSEQEVVDVNKKINKTKKT